MRGERRFRFACDFDGRELPHAREKNIVMRAGVFHEESSAARVAENRGGDADFDGRTLFSRAGISLTRPSEGPGTIATPGKPGSAGILGVQTISPSSINPWFQSPGDRRARWASACRDELPPDARFAQFAANGLQARQHSRDVAVQDGYRNS